MIRDFINARLNRDNFWNLMFFALFFVGIFGGLAVEQPFGGVVFLIAFIAAIILVKRNTQLTFDAEKLEFTTSQGGKIKTLGGVGFIWVLIISFFLALFPYGLFAKGTIFESLYNNLVYAFFFALIPSLYCILFNFPISVYFQKEAWQEDPVNLDDEEYNSTMHHEYGDRDRNIVTDPSYRHLGCNIYNKR